MWRDLRVRESSDRECGIASRDYPPPFQNGIPALNPLGLFLAAAVLLGLGAYLRGVKLRIQPDPTLSSSGEMMGYGYQWWIPREPDGDFLALGVYGQNIYVDPKNDLVIVKNAADLSFQENDFENDEIALALYRTIAAELNAKP